MQGPVSRNTRKAIFETAIRLFWNADLLRCFQDNKKQITERLDDLNYLVS